jgi:hypothetical protein
LCKIQTSHKKKMNITGSAKRKRVDASTLNVSSTSSLQGDVTAFQDVSILGNLSVTGSTSLPVVVPSVIYVADGSDAAPSYSFVDEKDVGFLRSATGEVDFVSGGAKRLRMSDTTITPTVPVSIPDGSATAPSLIFTTTPTTGLYSEYGEVKAAVSGVERFNVTNTGAVVYGQLSTLGDTKTTGDFYGTRTILQDGRASAPSHTFLNDTTAGMYLLPSHGGLGLTFNSFSPVAIFKSDGTTLTTLTATTVNTGALNATGDVKATNVTATANVTGSTITGQVFEPTASGAILMTTASPDALIASQTADITICPALSEAVRFNTTASTFSVPVSVPYGITGGNGSFSTLSSSSTVTGSTVTATNQVLTTFGVTAATAISTSSFTLFSGWSTTPALSRGTAPVTVSGSQFTIHSTGYYDVGFQIMWAANATGQRSATMRINGAPTNFAYDIRNCVTGGFVTSNMGSMKRYLSSGDYIEVEVWQNSGGSLNIQNNGNQIVGMSFVRIC